MTSLLRRAATCAGLAACGFSAVSQAQSTTTVLPQRSTDLRRSTPAATAPIIQQSPNGLYKLSITDTGIELIGPQGVVRITSAGIEIGGPNTPVAIDAKDMKVRSGQMLRLDAGTIIDLKGGSTVQMTSGSQAAMKLDAEASLTGSRVTLGCFSTNGKPAARRGDEVNTSVSPPMIAQGSQTVLVC